MENLEERKKRIAIENTGLTPYIDNTHRCGTCRTVGQCHPDTGYCFKCDTDNWIEVEAGEIQFNLDNLRGIKRSADKYFTEIAPDQFWVFKDKTIEVHDQYGKVCGFRKKSIQFAMDNNVVVLNPFS